MRSFIVQMLTPTGLIQALPRMLMLNTSHRSSQQAKLRIYQTKLLTLSSNHMYNLSLDTHKHRTHQQERTELWSPCCSVAEWWPEWTT